LTDEWTRFHPAAGLNRRRRASSENEGREGRAEHVCIIPNGARL
jgi:hypothetical protein